MSDSTFDNITTLLPPPLGRVTLLITFQFIPQIMGMLCKCDHHIKAHPYIFFPVSQLNGEEGESSFVRLFSDTTFDNIATLPLHSFESGCSIITCQFLDDPNTYIVVGTAYVFAEESEPSKVCRGSSGCASLPVIWP